MKREELRDLYWSTQSYDRNTKTYAYIVTWILKQFFDQGDKICPICNGHGHLISQCCDVPQDYRVITVEEAEEYHKGELGHWYQDTSVLCHDHDVWEWLIAEKKQGFDINPVYKRVDDYEEKQRKEIEAQKQIQYSLSMNFRFGPGQFIYLIDYESRYEDTCKTCGSCIFRYADTPIKAKITGVVLLEGFLHVDDNGKPYVFYDIDDGKDPGRATKRLMEWSVYATYDEARAEIVKRNAEREKHKGESK